MQFSKWLMMAAVAAGAAGLFGFNTPTVRAADHGDAPNVAGDQDADLADAFIFLDPNDNSKVVLIGTFHGFIVPGEAVNFGVFDPATTIRFEIENTGDFKADKTIDVNFSPKVESAATAQTATVTISGKPKVTFSAPTTVPTLAATAPTPVVTTDAATGIAFYAGENDDPFFFDIPAFSRFNTSARAGTPDVSVFNRARDSFAGYNCLTIAMSIPKTQLTGSGPKIGVQLVALRKTKKISKTGEITASGKGKQVDRIATPAVNVALVPYARKNEYNVALNVEGSKNVFATDIVNTLTILGSNADTINALAGIVVSNGDYVRLDPNIANTGTGGGTNPEAAFPNGRRLGDDAVDLVLTTINNGAALGDNVNANDVPLIDTFPFVAPPQQPRDNGVIDDNTRN